ncbi:MULTISPECIES: hypothetical protein [unclassified Deinococcus]|uniref:hypothetical protein n=1 Tax=unclassified Deinococcus TaxID=2623546 RepID=UPI001E59AEE7|nr:MULTISPECIES: hypothetical protein [unclassified Deinococcus]MCD0156256.1 hypothetical protein [Deinococcus sp. 6GRE01]MCD0160092.1 hypothetical protein [Deinococcus sp. 6YEL10]
MSAALTALSTDRAARRAELATLSDATLLDVALSVMHALHAEQITFSRAAEILGLWTCQIRELYAEFQRGDHA